MEPDNCYGRQVDGRQFEATEPIRVYHDLTRLRAANAYKRLHPSSRKIAIQVVEDGRRTVKVAATAV